MTRATRSRASPELALLGGELRRGRQVLQRAAAADAEMRAARCDALGRGLEHLEQLAVVVLAVPPRAPEADALARQRAGDEHGLAAVHDALAFVRERADRARLRRGLIRGCDPAPRAPRRPAPRRSSAALPGAQELGEVRLLRGAQKRAHALELLGVLRAA